MMLLNGGAAEPASSDISEETAVPTRPALPRPPRADQVARASRQEARRSVARLHVRIAWCSSLWSYLYLTFSVAYCIQTSTESSPAANAGASGRPVPRRKPVRWSADEEAALIEGYRLYEKYSNVWMLIKMKFPGVLRNRSNVDLKDKYRNLVRYGKIPQADGDGTDNAGATDNDGTDAEGHQTGVLEV
ncbi:unnamed protein product [Phytophthora fragariaefolia]|uniref:Unnamed protein product n=1 Tax=Phytophthora fragariaefolia TaxID=1490495 RepID=A0A9W6XGS6_9STRA|nr:unnamed protein product [Phytophthora fragariaefolia]